MRGIKFAYMPANKMTTDSLTKGLGATTLLQIRDNLKLVDD